MESSARQAGHGTAEDIFRDRPYRVAGKTGTARARSRRRIQGPPRLLRRLLPRRAPGVHHCRGRPAPHPIRILRRRGRGPVFRAVADHLYGTRPELAGDRGMLLAEAPRLPVSMNGQWSTLEALYTELGVPFLVDTTGMAYESLTHVAAKTGDRRDMTARSTESAVPDVRGMSLRDALQLLERQGLARGHRRPGNGALPKHCWRGSAPRNGQTILLELS